jgi:hypothetical protein
MRDKEPKEEIKEVEKIPVSKIKSLTIMFGPSLRLFAKWLHFLSLAKHNKFVDKYKEIKVISKKASDKKDSPNF